MTEGLLSRPRCGVCGKVMLLTSEENRQFPVEVMVLLTMVNTPPSLVKQFICFHTTHGSVWRIPIHGTKDIWVY